MLALLVVGKPRASAACLAGLLVVTWSWVQAGSTHSVPKPLVLKAKELLLWEMDSLKLQDVGCRVLVSGMAESCKLVHSSLLKLQLKHHWWAMNCIVMLSYLIRFWRVSFKQKYWLAIACLVLSPASLCVKAL